MIKIQGLRVLVKQFLSAAADEIVEAVEKMISGYEEEMFQSKREISRQRKMLDALLQPEIRLNRISEEAQLNLSVWEEDFLTEQQEWNSSPRQKNPESLQTERSHKEPLSSSQDRRPEDDTIHDTFTPQCVKNEHEIYKEEEEPLPVTAEQTPIEADEEVPSPGISEPEIRDKDENWRVSDSSQDEHSDRSEEWGNSGKPSTPTANPRDICGLAGLCGRHFETEKDLQCQLNVNVKAAVCDVCGKLFGSFGGLEIHMKIHTGEKPFRCKECGKSFNCQANLEVHIRIHTGKHEKRFSCSDCGKAFYSRHNMIRHKRTHTGEKPYICNVCGRCFSDSSSLKRHFHVHAGAYT